ncbi:TPA: hypothetical protein ACNE13_005179, partial [Escherichia coli]
MSEITAHIASRSTDIFIFLCVHGLQGIQGQFSFHHGISLAAAPSPAGRRDKWFMTGGQAALAWLSVRSVVSVC